MENFKTYYQIMNSLTAINEYYGPMTVGQYAAMEGEEIIAMFESITGKETFTIDIYGDRFTFDNHEWTPQMLSHRRSKIELMLMEGHTSYDGDEENNQPSWTLIEHRVGDAVDYTHETI
jgi:hypothetical protein